MFTKIYKVQVCVVWDIWQALLGQFEHDGTVSEHNTCGSQLNKTFEPCQAHLPSWEVGLTSVSERIEAAYVHLQRSLCPSSIAVAALVRILQLL